MAEEVKQLDNKTLDTSALDKLTPEQRALAISILKEYVDKGHSEKLDSLILADYEEVPVDILTFVDDYNYLGNAWHDKDGKSKLYPYWRKELVKLFPDNLSTSVNNTILSGSRGRGKAQPLDSLVFTEDGYKKMGDLKVGDKVYGRDGNLYPILGIYPQGKKKIVEITFSDGTKTKCSDEHLWTVKDNNINKFVTITAKEIYENGIYKRKLENGWTEKRYSLPKLEPLKYEHKEHLISPYMLGCLLGDGCFCDCVGMTTADEEIKTYFIKELSKNDYEIHNHSKDENDICFYIKNKNHTNSLDKNIYWEEIKKLDLAKHTSCNKFIPNEYLYSDVNDRIELLQGLLDTDGECRKDGQISFVSTSKILVENVIWLVQSLGGLATNYKEISHKYHYINKKNNIDEIRDAANVYSVGIKVPKNIQPFKLTRKLERLNPNRIEPKRRIIDIKYLEDKEECQCIYIGSEEHLYLTNDLIVTHNTEIATLIIAYMLHRVLCLKDPVAYFHLKPTEKLVFAFMNIKLALAEEIGIAKFQNTIQSSPWFMAHGELEGRTKKVWIPKKYNGREAIDIKIGSQADDLIGLPVYCLDGDTVILTNQGEIALKNALDKKLKVLTRTDNGEFIYSDDCEVRPTIKTSDEYQIELEDGSIIKCTPNHRFLLTSGEYKEAQNLCITDEIMDFIPYGYIYKTTNLINNKIYIGQKKSNKFLGENYLGRGENIKKAIKKYGKENFKVELLEYCENKISLDLKEKEYIQKFDSKNFKIGYNIADEGQGGDLGDMSRKHISEKIKKISKITLDEPKQYYDVINAKPFHNFLIKTNKGYIISHNCAFFDEISFMKNQDVEKQKEKANDMIDTAIGGMKTRFVHKGKNPTMLILASSKRSDKSFLEEHMKKKLKSEKTNVYISDGSVWEVKPKGTYKDEWFKVALGNKFLQSLVIPDGEDERLYIAKGYKILPVPIDFKADFIDDIDRSLCDFAGISSSSITKYINGQAVTDIINDAKSNPFQCEILEIGNANDDDRQYYNFFDMSKIDKSLLSKPLFVHLDMSVSGDMTGIAGVFIKGKKPSVDANLQNNDLFYSLAFSVSIKAPKGRQISFDKNRNFIYWLKEKGFNIQGITTDTYQSYDTGQTLKAKGYPYDVLSVDRCDSDRICKPYQYFKSTIYDKRIEFYEDKTLIDELINLERNMDTGKVDHPDGGKKDVADAVCGALFNASKHAEEFAYEYGESAEDVLRLNSNDYSDDIQQLTLNLEEEIKRMKHENFLGQNTAKLPEIDEFFSEDDIIII